MLQHKRVAILGGSRGIGFAVAQAAIRDGAQVVIASSQQENVANAVKQLPEGAATGAAVNLRSTESIEAFFATLGEFDHLAFTAGEPLPFGPTVVETDMAAARGFFDLRYWGVVAAVKAAQPNMRAGGSIVLTSGTSAHRPPVGFAFAASICGAIESFTRALALEFAPLRVNVVTPGMVATELWSGLPPEAREHVFRSTAEKLPVGRVGKPEDIAEAYLSFMRNGYATGQSLIVDGGGVLI